MSRRMQSRFAWLGLGIVVIGVLFAPIYDARGSGRRELIVRFQGKADSSIDIRVASLPQNQAAYLLTDPPHPEVRWRSIRSGDETVKMEVIHGTNITSSLLLPLRWKYYPYQDALAVEYRTAKEPLRFRFVSFKDRPFSSTIELTIPREPPTDAEAWRPSGPIPMPDA